MLLIMRTYKFANVYGVGVPTPTLLINDRLNLNNKKKGESSSYHPL